MPQHPSRRSLLKVVSLLSLLSCAGIVAAYYAFPPDGGARPGLVGLFGRFHPILLHAPVVLLPFGLLAEIIARRRPNWREAADATLALAAFSTVTATLAGIALGYTGGYSADGAGAHLLGGVITSGLAGFSCFFLGLEKKFLRNFGVLLLVATQGVLIWTAHLGANITHGENFIQDGYSGKASPPQSSSPAAAEGAAPANDPAFEAVVRPILDTHCVSCHKAEKPKGGLSLHTLSAVYAGGAGGPSIIPGNPAESLLIKRMRLASSNDEAMPPAPKPRVPKADIEKIAAWIASLKPGEGKPAETKPDETKPDAKNTEELFDPEGSKSLEQFGETPPPPEGAVPLKPKSLEAALAFGKRTGTGIIPASLRLGDGITLRTQTVHATFDDKALAETAPFAGFIIDADLSLTKVTDAGLAKSLPAFKRVRRLNLAGLPVKAAAIKACAALPELDTLVLTDTAVADGDLAPLHQVKKLRAVYLLGSKATSAGIGALKKALPRCEVLAETPAFTTADAGNPKPKNAPPPDSKGVKAILLSATSEMGGGYEAANIIDGNPATFWHSTFNPTVTKYPHVLEFDLLTEQKIKGFTQLPRQDGESNGWIKHYEVAVSADRKTWKTVKNDNFTNKADINTVYFDAPAPARYLRFTALSSQNGADYASCAELLFIKE